MAQKREDGKGIITEGSVAAEELRKWPATEKKERWDLELGAAMSGSRRSSEKAKTEVKNGSAMENLGGGELLTGDNGRDGGELDSVRERKGKGWNRWGMSQWR